jgi:hypothetical protein
MSNYSRGYFSIFFLYVGVIVIALAGIAIGLTAIVKTATRLTQQVQRDQTLLDLRIQSSREIRQALGKPLPPLQPLPPITARLAHTVGSRVVVSQPVLRKMTQEASDVLASGSDRPSSSWGTQSSAYAEIDRHAYQ